MGACMGAIWVWNACMYKSQSGVYTCLKILSFQSFLLCQLGTFKVVVQIICFHIAHCKNTVLSSYYMLPTLLHNCFDSFETPTFLFDIQEKILCLMVEEIDNFPLSTAPPPRKQKLGLCRIQVGRASCRAS